MKAKTRRKRAYDASGRREEAERTKERIVEAAGKLLRTVRPESLSYGDVADASGVAVRTVYRHFPELTELLRAVARTTIQRFAADGLSKSRAEGAAQLAAFHRVLSAEPSLFRIFMAAPVRSELDYERVLRELYADVLEGFSPEHRTALLALFDLLSSPFAWEVLHTNWHLPPERITRACLAAAQVFADGIRRHPDWLEPSEPPPPLFGEPRSSESKRKGHDS
ncbi:MAG TPA: TetR/AcrR family transcriptional regulator [Polyangiaceae bacterium]|nr:TetR/AcrR family transcriptional regulator [Polyangiaceae bacterium]